MRNKPFKGKCCGGSTVMCGSIGIEDAEHIEEAIDRALRQAAAQGRPEKSEEDMRHEDL